MKLRIRSLIDTYRQNFRMTQWPKTVLDAFEEPALIVDRFHQERATINADANLTPQGKAAATQRAAKAALDALGKWQTPKLSGLDTQVAQQRASLAPQGPKPDPRRVDYLLARLQGHTPEEIATFYNAATDEERVLMEAASASVGRIPTKTANGLQWQPLIASEVVNDSVLARAQAKDPAGVAKFNELTEIRAMHVTVAQHAQAEIAEAARG
jgi:hypothetical protein